MRAATVLRRSGWTAEMFKAGEPIKIEGAPDRFDVNSCYVHTVVFADGTTADRYAQLSKPAATAAPAAPRAAAQPKRRAEHHGRLGAGASRHDGPARPKRRARAREPCRGVRAGHGAGAAGGAAGGAAPLAVAAAAAARARA